jgi:hypothetical protein
LEEDFGSDETVTDKQMKLLAPAKKISQKRKAAAKNPSESLAKKISLGAPTKKMTKKRKKEVPVDEEAEVAEALTIVAKVIAVEKAAEAEANKSWDSHVEAAYNPNMDSQLSPEALKEKLTKQNIYQTLDNETCEASTAHLSNIAEGTQAVTEQEITKPASPPNIFHVDQTTLALETTPKAHQTEQPQQQQYDPEPSLIQTLHNLEIVNETLIQQSNPEIVDNSQTLTLTKEQIQNLSKDLETINTNPPLILTPEQDAFITAFEEDFLPKESLQISSDNQASTSKNLPDTILSQPPRLTLKDIEHVLRTFNDNIRKLCLSLPKMSILPSQIYAEIDSMKEDNILMFDTIKRAYGREFKLIHILMINNMESALEKARKEVMFLTMSSHEELEAAV